MSKDIEYENLINDDTFSLLGREKFMEFILGFIAETNSSVSIAIKGSWGSGKTVFVKNLNDLMNNNKDNIKSYYFDAWKHDYYESPLLALLNEILKEKEFSSTFDKLIDEGKNQITYNAGINLGLFSIGFSKHKESIKNEILRRMEVTEYSQTIISSLLNDHSDNKDRDKKIVFIIDELDRCRPEFVAKMFEQIKHVRLNYNTKVTIIYTIDYIQTIASLKSYYGLEYCAGTFLDKIIDYDFDLPKIDISTYVDYVIKYLKVDTIRKYSIGTAYYDVLKEFTDTYNFNLRDFNKLARYLDKILNFEDQRVFELEIEKIILTLIVMLKIKDPMLYLNVLNENASKVELISEIKLNANLDKIINEYNRKKENSNSFDKPRGISVGTLIREFYQKEENKESRIESLFSDL